jgi:putative oxidoreductase
MPLNKDAARLEPLAYALLRIVAGAMFAMHGVQKLFDWPVDRAGPEILSQMGIGGVIELVGGALIALGLFARPAAFLASGTMAVAYFQFHWKLAFAELKWLPGVNKGELAAMYCFVFLLVAAKGAGILSIDGRRGS